MTADPQSDFISLADYFTQQENALYRSEYEDGQIVAMTGGSADHAQIIANLSHYLYPLALRRGCRIYPSEMSVRVTATRYYLPDVVIVCGPPPL